MQEPASTQYRLFASQTDQQLDEFHQFFVWRLQSPGIPADVVVLAIGVVIAPLGAKHGVTTEEHRRSLGEEEGGQKIPSLAGACFQNPSIVRRSLDTVICLTNVVRA